MNSNSQSRQGGKPELPDIQEHTAIGTLTKESPTESNQISIPKIELPKGGGAIKGIDEKFKVNAANGTASLGVPLPITSGRQGFSPSLNLSYSSGGGNGPFGLGWSLDLPQISRKTDQGIPRYSGEDVFTMSGAEDLVPYLLEDNLGNWTTDRQQAGTYTVTRYRPRITSDHSRIELIEHAAHQSYWRVTSAANVVTIFGRSPQCRIADPVDGRKIFTWLPEFSYDDKGNWMRYSYKEEDLMLVADTVQEKHRRSGLERFTNRYLKRVRYGNALPYTPDPSLPYDPSAPTDDTCYFELILDYGEHDTEVPLPSEVPNQPWPVRQDAFSSYRSGFEIRTYRLCRNILMFHHFPQEQNQDGSDFGVNYLVRSLAFSYVPSSINDSGAAEVNYLAQITGHGFVRKGDGTYSKKSLPALTMEYRHLQWNTDIKQASQNDLENLPEGLSGQYQFVDLYGEGISGLLTEQGNGWYYKNNLGDIDDDGEVQFGSMQPVLSKPNFTGLGSAIALADLDADGLKEMVIQGGGVQGFYSMGTGGEWQDFTSFQHLPNLDISDPNVRLLDLTGDGKPDLVMTEERVITYYQSKGKLGYEAHARALKALDEERGPALVFADDHNKVMLADMSGDGLTDIVRIRNGEVCYWPNKGYGRFGAKVTMGNVPRFDLPDRFNSLHLHLTDISGTGASDIIYTGDGHFKAYINMGGNALSDVQVIEPFFPIDDMVNLQTVDLLGTGTSCLVWSSGLPGDRTYPLRYIDLMGSRKPHVLTAYENSMGMRTSLDYRSSTHFYLTDKLAGYPWITKLPFPVQVVERSTVEDAVTNTQFSTRYTYHHGFYDHEEREFRGFGRVDQYDTEQYLTWKDENEDSAFELSEETFQPPVLTRTWYHTGAFFRKNLVLNHFKSEYWPARYENIFPGELGVLYEPELPDAILTSSPSILDPNVLDWLTAGEYREASRACKGMVLRTEVFDLKAVDSQNPTDDERRQQLKPYTVAAHNCRILLQQPQRENEHACFQVLESEAFTLSYEKDISDPRISHSLMIETDRYGNVLHSASVAYNRLNPDLSLPQKVQQEQAKIYITFTRNKYTNDVLSGNSYRLRMPCEAETFELRNIPKSGQFYTLSDFDDALAAATTEIPYVQPHTNAAERRKIEHSHNLFLKDDLSGALNPGELESLGLAYESYALAYTPAMLSQLFPAGFLPNNILATDGFFVHFNGDSAWWVPSGTARYLLAGEGVNDAAARFFSPMAYRDPAGSQVQVTYYKTYYFFTQSSTDALGNTITAERFNFRTLSPVTIRDANDTLSTAISDELGMVKATALLGKDLDGDGTPESQLADSLSGLNEWTDDEEPAIQNFFQLTDADAIDVAARNFLRQATSRYVYDLHAWTTHQKPSVTCGIMRETHHADLTAGQESALQIAFEYTSGMGQVAMVKSKAEPGLAKTTTLHPDGTYTVAELDTSPAIRWLGNGRTVLNNKGNMVKQYQPYFSVTPAYEDAPELVETGETFIIYYDSLGRHISTIFPDDTLQEIHFDAWKKEIWDQNDMALQSPWYNDRINRLIDSQLTADGKDPAKEQTAAAKTAAHDATPSVVHFDSLGRPVLTVAHNKRHDNSDEFIQTSIDLDLEGNAQLVTDARGNTVMNYQYNMLGTRVYSNSMDAGERWQFANALGKLLISRDARNHTVAISYDALHRETQKRVTGGDGVLLNHVFERLIYGENQANDKALNLRGKVWHHYDTAGKVESVAFDLKGNLRHQFRKLNQDYKAVPDWSGANPDASLQAGSGSETRMTYDALNRIRTQTHPDGSTVTHGYNAAGLLDRVDVTRNGTTEEYVKNIDYNEKGQRRSITYGNDIRTTYTYDRETFRLLTIISRRQNNELLQELHYTYDAVGNITETEDRAIPTRFFANQLIAPRNRYTYDAVYRLTEAQGKEHVAQVNHSTCDNWKDLPFLKKYSPNDDMQWRNYTQTYRYDLVGNILEMRHLATNGNWTRTYTYEATTNRLIQTQVGGQTYTYAHHPAHGFLTSLPHLQNMSWNFRDELSGTTTQRICTGTEPETTFYVYNGAGKRVRKITENQGAGGNPPTVKEERLYLGDVEIYTKISGNYSGLIRTTLHISDNQGRIAMIDSRNGIDDGTDTVTVRYQLGNRSNSAHLELDGTGAVISYEEYHPYGTTAYQAVSATIRAAAKRYRYTGMERDEETGLSYHNARYYMPWLGRWLKPDPVGMAAGVNFYSYVNNNPVKLIDPNGTDDDEGWGWGTYLAIGAVVAVGVVATIATAGVAGPAFAAAGSAIAAGAGASAATAATVGTVTAVVAGGAAAGAVGNVAATATSNALFDREDSLGDAAISGAAAGVITAGAGAAIGAAARGAGTAARAAQTAGTASRTQRAVATVATAAESSTAARTALRATRGATLGAVGGATAEATRQVSAGESLDAGRIGTAMAAGAVLGGVLDPAISATSLPGTMAQATQRASGAGTRAGISLRSSVQTARARASGENYLITRHGDVSGREVVSVATPEGPKAFYNRTGGGGTNSGGAKAGDWAPFEGFSQRDGVFEYNGNMYRVPNEWFIKHRISAGLDESSPLYRFGSDQNISTSKWLLNQNIPKSTTSRSGAEVNPELQAAGIEIPVLNFINVNF
ncbi:SpvB/TcaC N-terminal domain-containing protein [Arundinibacter roseus]|uniref:Insecticidal toxin complex protein n=1 Tax=Arundinibacter roseus TaxID=2070510 RepID=A0A4R4KLB1_9BACT|nr:SpvB/TcaC N-terminal domain-containing protein [Arundinibacter roseus]TDB67509.1 insecticidal toxin complex protein [Arundinibacter roseus]